MHKRPLNARFNAVVLGGVKITTIRDKVWPVGEPIMLYNWSGAAYRSKQKDVAVVKVMGFWLIQITHMKGGEMSYAYGNSTGETLHETEGFESREELDKWFRPLIKPGQTVTKFLMRFRVVVEQTKKMKD